MSAPWPSIVLCPFLCPTEEWGVAWDLREMGSSWGRGVREGPAPQEARKISSQCSARAEATWGIKKRNKRVGGDEERTSANRVSYFPHERFNSV
jgi:hypothetical protein